MKIIYLPAQGQPTVRDIPNTINAFMEQLNWPLTIDTIRFAGDVVAVVTNADAHLRYKVQNMHLSDLMGNAFICGLNGNDIPDNVVRLLGLGG